MKFEHRGKVIEIETPWQLNEGQEEALKLLQQFYEDPNQSQFTLVGSAGTGKTSIVNIFHKFLKKCFVDPLYSAPTHRALAVIRQSNPSAAVSTLAKLFGLRPQFNIESGDYNLEQIVFNQQGKPQLSHNDFLVIDEASMVNSALYDFIQIEMKKLKLKVLYVGDAAQLKPVKEENISRVFRNKNGKIFQLTKVERTGDNPVLWESNALREGKDFSGVTRITEEGYGVYYVTRADMLNIISTEFIQLQENPLHIRCLSATNQVVMGANKRIREILGFHDQINVGDILMGYDNFGLDYVDKTYQIINSGDYQVIGVEPYVKKVENIPYQGFNVKLKNAMDPREPARTVFIVDNRENSAKVQTFVDKVKSLNIQAESARLDGNRKLMAMYFSKSNELKGELAFMKDHRNSRGEVFQKRTIDYGYSHTIHKSQGGTYEKVMIMTDTISAFPEAQLRQQLKYVAMSRAKKNVFVLKV